MPWAGMPGSPQTPMLAPMDQNQKTPFFSLGDLPDQEVEPTSPALTSGFFTAEPPGKPQTGHSDVSLMPTYVDS